MQYSLGEMSVGEVFDWKDRSSNSISQTVAAFVEYCEGSVTRWIQTLNGVMLLIMAPGDPQSGGVYVFQEKLAVWYMLAFENCYSEFTAEQFDRVFSEYQLFTFIE